MAGGKARAIPWARTGSSGCRRAGSTSSPRWTTSPATRSLAASSRATSAGSMARCAVHRPRRMAAQGRRPSHLPDRRDAQPRGRRLRALPLRPSGVHRRSPADAPSGRHARAGPHAHRGPGVRWQVPTSVEDAEPNTFLEGSIVTVKATLAADAPGDAFLELRRLDGSAIQPLGRTSPGGTVEGSFKMRAEPMRLAMVGRANGRVTFETRSLSSTRSRPLRMPSSRRAGIRQPSRGRASQSGLSGQLRRAHDPPGAAGHARRRSAPALLAQARLPRALPRADRSAAAERGGLVGREG